MIYASVDAARSKLWNAIQANNNPTAQDDYCQQFLKDAKASLDEAQKLYQEMERHIGVLKNPIDKD